jgi:DNA replication and repair protein RecF
VALKLVELVSLHRARGTEPALILDDVFAELDRDRQRRLAARVLGNRARQVFLTAPRRDELPPEADMPVWNLESGRVSR